MTKEEFRAELINLMLSTLFGMVLWLVIFGLLFVIVTKLENRARARRAEAERPRAVIDGVEQP